MTAAMVKKLNGISEGANNVTISSKTDTFTFASGSYFHTIDLGKAYTSPTGNGLIFGLNGHLTSNANQIVKCAVQSGRHLRFQVDTALAGSGVTYEYFVIKIS